MNTSAKQKPADVTQQIRDMTDTGAQRSKEALESMGTATTQAAEIMKNSYSGALNGMQDYHSKIIEFTQANTKTYVEFVQRLSGVKSPSEFFEVSTGHARHQLEILGEQAKQLAELAQKATLAAAEPLKTGMAKTYQ